MGRRRDVDVGVKVDDRWFELEFEFYGSSLARGAGAGAGAVNTGRLVRYRYCNRGRGLGEEVS